MTKAIFHYIKKESYDISATITTVVNILMPENETIFDGRSGQLASILTLQYILTLYRIAKKYNYF